MKITEQKACNFSLEKTIKYGSSILYTKERLISSMKETSFFDSKEMETEVINEIVILCKKNERDLQLAINMFDCFKKPSSLSRIIRESIISWKKNTPNEFLRNFLYFFVSFFLSGIETYLKKYLKSNAFFELQQFPKLKKLSDKFSEIILEETNSNQILFFNFNGKRISRKELFKSSSNPNDVLKSQLFSRVKTNKEGITELVGKKEGMMPREGMMPEMENNNNDQKSYNNNEKSTGNPSLFGGLVFSFVGLAFMLRFMGFKVHNKE